MAIIKNKKQHSFMMMILVLLIVLMLLTKQTLSISTTTMMAFVNDVSSSSSSSSRLQQHPSPLLTGRNPMKTFLRYDTMMSHSLPRQQHSPAFQNLFQRRRRTTTTTTTTTTRPQMTSSDNADDNEYGTTTTTTNESTTIKTSQQQPIVVIGGGGKTGQIICKLLADQKQYVRAMVRTTTTRKHYENDDEYISYCTGDVTNYEDIINILKTPQQQATDDDEKRKVPPAVVWAATSSSGSDTTAFDVDCKGAYKVAKACLELNIPKLVFISAGCVTRPNAPGSKAVNWLTQFTYGKDVTWGTAKMAGETAVRDLYNKNKNKNKNINSSYTIIRPAAALVQNKKPIPVNDLVVMQGDVYSSAESLSRENVAKLVVSLLLNNGAEATDFCTIEIAPAYKLYKNEEGNMIDLVGLKSNHQITVDELDLPKDLIHTNARTYQDLFLNDNNNRLLTDEELHQKYPSLISNYRGDEDNILIRRLFRSGNFTTLSS